MVEQEGRWKPPPPTHQRSNYSKHRWPWRWPEHGRAGHLHLGRGDHPEKGAVAEPRSFGTPVRAPGPEEEQRSGAGTGAWEPRNSAPWRSALGTRATWHRAISGTGLQGGLRTLGGRAPSVAPAETQPSGGSLKTYTLHNSRKGVRGARIGRSSLRGRKGRWTTLPQPPPPAGGAPPGAHTFHPSAGSSAPRHFAHGPARPARPRGVRLCHLVGGGRVSQLSWPCCSPAGEAPGSASSEAPTLQADRTGALHLCVLPPLQDCVPCTMSPHVPPSRWLCTCTPCCHVPRACSWAPTCLPPRQGTSIAAGQTEGGLAHSDPGGSAPALLTKGGRGELPPVDWDRPQPGDRQKWTPPIAHQQWLGLYSKGEPGAGQ